MDGSTAQSPEPVAGKLPRPSAFDFYPKAREPYSSSLFQNPTAEYRGAPLWAWNNKLSWPELSKEMDAIKEMGIGGVCIHSRVGLDTPYMGQEFLDLVRKSMLHAKENGMYTYLYDEDRWPSGCDGGLITRDNPDYRSQHLLFTTRPYGDPAHRPGGPAFSGAMCFRSELGYLIARYIIKLDEKGYMSQTRLKDSDPDPESTEDATLWYAYVESNPTSEWFNNSFYVDQLNPEATQAFIQSTHEKYKKSVGDEFGKNVPAIFTDEPQFAWKTRIWPAHDKTDQFMPWTKALTSKFTAEYGYDILDHLPELFWDDLKHLPSKPRYDYHNFTCELFVAAYMDPIADWCENNKLALMGHMDNEPSLGSQTEAIGEAMRCYRSMQIPGMDLLCDGREFTTAKQVTSVARQYARSAAMSEIYGVTNWTFSFTGYKGCGDWQAALGITLRIHHLSWVSMAGEGKRDYPAQLGYQSPWYKEFPEVEDHFARLSTVLSRGKSVTRVGVIHPIESFWMDFTCEETSRNQNDMERRFSAVTDWLCYGLVDFDYISESLIPELVGPVDNPLAVGAQQYEVIILPELKTIRKTTLKVLEKFAATGGKIIVLGADARYVDVGESTRPSRLKAKRIPFNENAFLEELAPIRDVEVFSRDLDVRAHQMLYQMRQEGDEAFVFFCNQDRDHPRDTTIYIRGKWDLILLDTLTGKEWALKSDLDDIWTTFNWLFEGCASLLLRLAPRKDEPSLIDYYPTTFTGLSGKVRPQDIVQWGQPHNMNVWSQITTLSEPKTSLSEPNALLLDMARYCIDDGGWNPAEEILRIDNIARRQLGFHQKTDGMAQPWTRKKTTPVNILDLKFIFHSEIPVYGAVLALEGAENAVISLDGDRVHAAISGFWVDEAIKTIPLPNFRSGKHMLNVTFPFNEATDVERMYILGDFGVCLAADRQQGRIIAPRPLTIGNYTTQGLPFYTGNVTYTFPFTGTGQHTSIKVPSFGTSPVLSVHLDGEKVGRIAYQPYTLELGVLQKGRHYEVGVTAFGTRDHAFGAVHMPEGREHCFGPGAWRSGGDRWSYGYTIRPMGLLEGVKVFVRD